MWYFIFFFSMAVILFALMVAQAPEGYEDKDGFHYGKSEEDKWK